MKETAYLLQATLISLWWIGLLINKDFYNAFQFPEIGNTAFNSFMLPDLIIVALLSVIRAYKKKQALDYVILGGFGFATLYCINATILTKGGFLATIVMTLGLSYNLFLINEKKVFRKSKTDNLSINSIKTILQIICVWTITLFVFPMVIMNSFDGRAIEVSNYKGLSIFLLVFFSAIGIYSAYTMVKLGKGTPLPLDQTQELVTKGAYKYVRNPMAIAGVGQGIAISILFSSIPVFVYTIIGAVLWQFVVRPMEEKNMTQRFGKAYEDYRKKVKCWIPRF